jgi:hypothetical protein
MINSPCKNFPFLFFPLPSCVLALSRFASLIPGLPNVSAIRTFRVLRPLKSVAGLDGVKMVLVAVTESIPALMSVIALLAFVFAIFGILGLQFFLGKYHSRCRLTPYPVTTSWVQGLDYRDYACLDPDKGDLMRRNLNKQEGTKRDSDWYSPMKDHIMKVHLMVTLGLGVAALGAKIHMDWVRYISLPLSFDGSALKF